MVLFELHNTTASRALAGNPGSGGPFHLSATVTVFFVCCYASVYQMLLMRPRAKRIVLYAWIGTDIIVFTWFLLFFVNEVPRRPLVAIYFCMVASAALSFYR